MNTYVETGCTIEHNGQTFEYQGAEVTEDRAVAYTQSTPLVGMPANGKLTTWHGAIIGTYAVVSKWPTRNSYVSTHRYAIEAVISGRRYYGRTSGQGMVVFLKAYKSGA
jgi:hypothetical protein